MKKLMRIAATLAIMMACCATVSAQENNAPQRKDGNRQKMTREQFTEKQARNIADQLALDDATTTKFIDTYCACQKEIWTLAPKPNGRQRGEKKAEKTEAQAEKNLKSRFEHSQKLLDIRQKYYKEYSKFLTQKQIERMYELEKQNMNRMNKGRRGNDNKRPPMPPKDQPQPQQNN